MKIINDNHQDLELKDFFRFEGRINRAKYFDIWGWNFSAQLTFIVSYNLFNNLGTLLNSTFLEIIGIISLVFFYVTSIIGRISLILNRIRRVHDCNKPGLYSFIPFYSTYLVWFKKGTENENEYGNNPLEKALPEKPFDVLKFNRQQKLLKILSLSGIFGGFATLIVLFIIGYL